MPDFSNIVSDHTDNILKVASQVVHDCVRIRSLQDGSQCHDADVSLGPVLTADFSLDKVENWPDDVVSHDLGKVIESASC